MIYLSLQIQALAARRTDQIRHRRAPSANVVGGMNRNADVVAVFAKDRRCGAARYRASRLSNIIVVGTRGGGSLFA